jgi:uncharacterized protein YvpB
VYTDYSKTALQTVCRLITMGTVLERMDEGDPDALVINRLPLHNYAVYLPVRNEDGSYGKTPALINARERVSEDYLPLTARNLATVALISLGDAYGWGAGLNNEDCTSLNHSIFCCFGLDMPRNGTWQQLVESMPRIIIGNYTLEEKEALLDALPMGAQPYDDENGVRHGPNPEREFVGDPRSEYSYGVFNEPIAKVAEQFMPGVKTEKGATVDDIKAILDTGNPVLTWYVSAPMRDIMYRWAWLDENGELVHWPGGEHAVVVCGYDDTSLTYREPNAGTTVIIDYDTFAKSFSELGGRIVYYAAQQ